VRDGGEEGGIRRRINHQGTKYTKTHEEDTKGIGHKVHRDHREKHLDRFFSVSSVLSVANLLLD
jgi:hypothetical protein